ncbi:MAG: thioredoxin family protein [Candidatus Omnitrophica bacterium]|nr:thioredoxin family protein [Candidatus Omnitrophota bacterium]
MQPLNHLAGDYGAWVERLIAQHGLWVGLPAVFVMGLAMNLTPCVYPMIPVTLAYFSHQAFGALGRTLRLALCYMLGIAASYAILGLLAARSGALFGSWLQHPAVLLGVAIIMVALSLSMFGLYDLRLPPALMQRFGKTSAGYGGAALMGVVVGIIGAPCVGPVLLALLLLVGQMANPAAGFVLFFTLGLGMGAPYVLLGLRANQLARLPKAGGWLVWTKKLLGVVLWGLALYFLKSVIPTRLVWLATVALLSGAGAYLGWLEPTKGNSPMFRRVRWVVGGLLIIAALAVGWPRAEARPGVAWRAYTAAAFAEAQRQQQPILVDVYADWCIPCLEMDHTTFRQAEVLQALASVATLRVDATREVSAEAQAFLDRLKVFGAPTVLFFDRAGRERKDLRLEGPENPRDFIARVKQIL